MYNHLEKGRNCRGKKIIQIIETIKSFALNEKTKKKVKNLIKLSSTKIEKK